MTAADDDRPDVSSSERPAVPVPGEDEKELSRRCAEERESMLPRETADCAGIATSELYESEEDGGS